MSCFKTKDCNWLGKDDKIEGFEWRSGTEGVTTGIQIWSKPFILEDKSGKEVSFMHEFCFIIIKTGVNLKNTVAGLE